MKNKNIIGIKNEAIDKLIGLNDIKIGQNSYFTNNILQSLLEKQILNMLEIWSSKNSNQAINVMCAFNELKLENDGSEIWSTNVKGEVLSTAAIDPKTVVVKTGSGELIGLEKTSGETLWSYRSKLPTLTIRGSSSPVIFDNNVFVTFDNGRLGVFDINSGYIGNLAFSLKL